MKKSLLSYFLLVIISVSGQAKCPKCGHGVQGTASDQSVTPLEHLDQGVAESGLSDGVYLGLTLGASYDVSKARVNIDDAVHAEVSSFSSKSKDVSFIAGGTFGYQRVFKETFMALEIGYMGPKQTVKKAGTAPVLAAGAPPARFQTHYCQDYSLFLVQKFGWLLAPRIGVYIKAGPVLGQFTLKTKILDHPHVSAVPVVNGNWVTYKKKSLGLELGFGVIQDLGDGWRVGIDLTHRRFQKISHDFEPAIDQLTEFKIAPKETLALVTVSYAF